MPDDQHLRPLERRVLAMQAEGINDAEIAKRFRRSPRFIHQVARLATLPGRQAVATVSGALRPVERLVLSWRERGVTPSELAPRFHKSAAYVDQVEHLARYKLSNSKQ
jgi:transcriptional regulator